MKTYTEKQRVDICGKVLDLISEDGQSLREACKNIGVPRMTVEDWLIKDFPVQYARAKEDRAELFFERTRKLILETPKDKDSLMKTKLFIENEHWVLARMSKKYGDKNHTEITGKMDMNFSVKDLVEWRDEEEDKDT